MRWMCPSAYLQTKEYEKTMCYSDPDPDYHPDLQRGGWPAGPAEPGEGGVQEPESATEEHQLQGPFKDNGRRLFGCPGRRMWLLSCPGEGLFEHRLCQRCQAGKGNGKDNDADDPACQ